MLHLAIARAMGWRYEWIDALPVDVYDILVDEFLAEHKSKGA